MRPSVLPLRLTLLLLSANARERPSAPLMLGATRGAAVAVVTTERVVVMCAPATKHPPLHFSTLYPFVLVFRSY